MPIASPAAAGSLCTRAHAAQSMTLALTSLWHRVVGSSTDRGWRALAFGDSNTARPTSTPKHWPALVERWGAGRIKVINAGLDGRTAAMDSGTLRGCQAIQGILRQHRSLDYVLVMLGTNDMKEKYGPPGLGQVVRAIDTILDAIETQSKPARPILLTPPPLGTVAAGELVGARPRLLLLAQALRELAHKRAIACIDIHSRLQPQEHLLPDQVHINQRAREIIAEVVWQTLHRLTSK